MGHTHYWEIKPSFAEAWQDVVRDARVIIRAASDPTNGITLAGPLGDGSPVIDADHIAFNGSSDVDGSDESFETFYLDPKPSDFEFCKTGREPYDVIVCVVLLRARELSPAGIVLRSDGNWSSDWSDARALYADIFDAEATAGLSS